MKTNSLVLLLLLCLLSGLSVAQKLPVVSKGEIKSGAANFDKLESEYIRIQNELKQLENQRAQLLRQMNSFNEQQKQTLSRLENLEQSMDEYIPKAASGGGSQDQLLAATKQMREMQMSFNLQYLQLQSQLQNENRSYTAISNIMKTKHDTAKNSINNVR